MRLLVWSVCHIALAVVACNPNNEGEDWPVQPGGGGGMVGGTIGSGSSGTDAGTDGNTTASRVCGMSEVLRWDECANAGLDALTVRVGTLSTTTDAAGGFTIGQPSGSNLVWRVSGGAQLASLREYPGGNQIPSITNALFQDIAASANVVLDVGAGTVFVQVLHMDAPVEGATATLAGSGDLVYYDDATAPGDFSLDATRADGIVWFPNVTPGAAVSFTITPPKEIGEPKITTVVVEAETATFATVVFP